MQLLGGVISILSIPYHLIATMACLHWLQRQQLLHQFLALEKMYRSNQSTFCGRGQLRLSRICLAFRGKGYWVTFNCKKSPGPNSLGPVHFLRRIWSPRPNSLRFQLENLVRPDQIHPDQIRCDSTRQTAEVLHSRLLSLTE